MKKILLSVFTLFIISAIYSQYPVLVNNFEGKFGFVDNKGDTVINCIYDKALPFSEGLALVKNNVKHKLIDKNGKLTDVEKFKFSTDFRFNIETWGYGLPEIIDIWECKYIDEKGNIKLTVPYRDAGAFYNGKAFVYDADKINYIDKNGKLLEDWNPIYESSVCVTNGEKYALSDKNGNLITDFVFESSMYFSENYACVSKNTGGNNYIYKYGLIDNKGNIILDYIYDDWLYFTYGKSIAKQDGQLFLIDITGKAISEKYNNLISVSENIYIAETENKFFLIDATGKKISADYEYLVNKYEGLLAYREDENYGLIDTTGKIILENNYTEISDFWGNNSFVGKDNNQDGLTDVYAMIDKKGNFLTDFKYNTFGYPYNGYCKVGIKKNNDGYSTQYLYGMVDTTGKQVIDCKYDNLFDFTENYCVAQSYTDSYYSNYGLLDKNGKVVIDFIYDYMSSPSNGLVLVTKEAKYGYVDVNGKVVIDFQYDYAYSFKEGKALVGFIDNITYEYNYFFIDKQNNKLTDFSISNAYDFYEGTALAYSYGSDYAYDYYDSYYDYNYKYNILNFNGTLLVPDTFAYCGYFDNRNIIQVGKEDENGYGNLYTYLDKSGKQLLPYLFQVAFFDTYPILKISDDGYTYTYALGNIDGVPVSDEYSSIGRFNNGFAKVKNSDGLYSFIDVTGKQIGEFYEKVDNFSNGKAKVYQDSKISYIDKEGNLSEPFRYDVIISKSGFSVFCYGESYGILNKSGEVVGFSYDTAYVFNDQKVILEVAGSKGIYNSTDNSVTVFTYLEDKKTSPIKAAVSGKYGFIDENFNWIVNPEYDNISDFKNGLATVTKDGKINTINEKGELQSKTWTWDTNAEFITFGDLNFVHFNNKYALIDSDKNTIGKWYYYVTEHNGNVVVKSNNLYYSITYDKSSNSEILTDYYGYTSTLYAQSQYTDMGYKYGFVDVDGNVVVDYQYDYVYPFTEGIAVAENYGQNYYYSYILIDETGEKITNEIYDYANSCSEGLICVKKGDKYGYIDKKGNTAIDFKFTYAYSFSDGIASVQLADWSNAFIDVDGNVLYKYTDYYIENYLGDYSIASMYIDYDHYIYALINRKGEIVSEWYEYLSRISTDVFVISKQSKFALISPDGKMISEWYDFLSKDVYTNIITVISDGKINFLDESGNFVSDEKRKELIAYNYYFYEGIATLSFSEDKNYTFKYGFIDEEGNVICEPQFAYVNNFSNGYAIVQNYDDPNMYTYIYAIVNKKGEVATEWYKSIENFGTDLFKVRKDDKYCILNSELKQVCDWTSTIISTSGEYFLVQNNDKFQLIDYNGNTIDDNAKFKEILEESFIFSEGLASFSIYDPISTFSEYGIIDSEGKIVLQPSFNFIGNFSEGLAVAMKYDDLGYSGKYGYINTKGEVVIEPQFENAFNFSDGMAKVSQYQYETYETSYGFIDKSGNLIIDYQYYFANDFKDGIAIVQKKFDYNVMMSCIDKTGKEFQNWYEIILEFKDGFALALKYDRFVLIDNSGNEISDIEKVKQRLSEDFEFVDGIAKIVRNSASTTEPATVIINQDGKTISEWYVSIGDFSNEGLAVVELDLDYDGYTEFGYINKSGNLVIDIQYPYAEKFNDGTARIGVPSSSYSYKYGIIDVNGDYVIDPVYDDARNFSEGFAVVAQSSGDYYTYEYGLIDKTGKFFIDYQANYLGDMHYGMCVTYNYNAEDYTYKYGFVNKKGKKVIDFKFDYASDFSDEGIAIIGIDDNGDYIYTYSFINSKGKQITDSMYEEVQNFVEGYGIVRKTVDSEYKSAFVDKTGKIVSDWFDMLYGFNDGYAMTYIDGKFVLLDKNFNVVDDEKMLKAYLTKNFTFYENLTVVKLNSKYGFINSSGEIIFDFKYDYADNFYYGSSYVEINSVGYYLYPDGTLTPAYTDYGEGYEDYW